MGGSTIRVATIPNNFGMGITVLAGIIFRVTIFTSQRFFLGYERPHISTCVAGAKKSFDGGILLGCKWTLCLVLLARHLPLHERIIRQLAIPESPKLQTILIQGAGLVRPARRSSTARAASTNRKHGATAFGLTTRLAPGSYSEYAFISRSRLFGSAIVF